MYTYLLTPWSRVLLKNLTGFRPVKKFHAFYGTRYFIHKCWTRVLTKSSVQIRGFLCQYFVPRYVFSGEELIASRPTPKLEDHSLSILRDSLLNITAATLHIGGRSSIRNLRTRHAEVTGTHLSMYRSCNTYRPFQGSFTAICNVGSLSNIMTRNWNRPEIIAKSEMALLLKKKN
jgi:hypothetical protein